MSQRIFLVCTATLLLALPPASVRAEGRSGRSAGRKVSAASRAKVRRSNRKSLRRARRLFKRASKAYSTGRYEKAAALFLEIHGIVGDPALLYNAADAFQKAGKIEKAIANYQAYLAAKPDATDRRAVEKTIATLKKAVASKKAPSKGNTGAGAGSAKGSGPAPATQTVAAGRPSRSHERTAAARHPMASASTDRPGLGVPARTKARPTSDQAGMRAARSVTDETPKEEQNAAMPPSKKRQDPLVTAGWALVGTTALLLTAMGVTALKMEDAEDQMKRLAIMIDPSTETRLTYAGSYKSDFERYQRQGRLYEKLTWGFAAAAGATALTAVILFSVHAGHAKKERQKVSVSPLMGRGRAGLVLQTQF